VVSLAGSAKAEKEESREMEKRGKESRTRIGRWSKMRSKMRE